MRVALLHSYYAGSAPSGENVAVDLQADALRTAGVDVTIVGVNTDDLAVRAGYRWRTALGVATGSGIDPTVRLRQTGCDVVHVHNLFPNFATRWLRTWPGPLVATVHNYRPLCAAGTLARDGAECTECVGRRVAAPALRHRCYRGSLPATVPLAVSTTGGVNRHQLLKRADRVVFLAPRAQRIYAEAGYSRLERTAVLPNFVHPIGSRQVRDRDGLPWLYFGRLAPEKGVLRMLEHWPRDLPLTIYGAGPDQAAVERACTGAVVFRGPAPRQELLDRLRDHRGLIFPTMFAEGLPTVYLEALAAGLPVVARRGNSAADDIEAFGSGVVFERFEQLPAAVASLDSTYEARSMAAANRYLEAFSPSAWTAGIVDIYRQAVADRARADAGRSAA